MTQVVRPEEQHALLLGDAHDAVHDALVLLVGYNLLAGVLQLHSSFTHSIGATAILEMVAAMPLARKSLAKERACFVVVAERAAQ